jgi:hypothetical protein
VPHTKREQPHPNKSILTTQDVLRLVEMCSGFVDLCAKLTGEIDPAATELLKTVMVEIQRDDEPVYQRFNPFAL